MAVKAIGCGVQIEAFSKLESEQGICEWSLNALIAVLARSGRMAEAEQQLSRAAEMAKAEGAYLLKQSPHSGWLFQKFNSVPRLRGARLALVLKFKLD